MRVMALIPALDAAATVGPVVRGVLEHIPDVVVVDDGSSDDTSGAAREAGARVVRHDTNLGKGAALVTGFRLAIEGGFDAVLTLDADGQHDPEYIPELMKTAEAGPAVTLGCRVMDLERFPKARYYTNRIGVVCISWRAKARIDDSQTGYRVYRTDFLKGVEVTSGRFATETELLIKAGRRGLGIACVPIEPLYPEDAVGGSHFRPVADTYRICMLFLRSFFW